VVLGKYFFFLISWLESEAGGGGRWGENEESQKSLKINQKQNRKKNLLKDMPTVSVISLLKKL